MRVVAANYFDGLTAVPHPVALTIADRALVIAGDGIDRRVPLSALQVSELLGSAPRVLRFGDAAFCEVSDAAGLQRLLAAQGIAPSRVSQWEGSLTWIGAGTAALIVLLVLAYLYAIPLAARMVAAQMPAAITTRLGSEVLAILDSQFLSPSRVPPVRQKELEAAFRKLKFDSGATGQQYQLLFRHSDALGSNAFALPSGTIVVTDGLMALARDDREILGVLAHEAGHVVHRHGLRNVLQNSIVGLLVAWFIGDISTLAAAFPTTLLQANYSRELETEADTYALDVMRANAIDPKYLGDILRRFDAATEGARAPRAFDYLSSHPATSERLKRLESR